MANVKWSAFPSGTTISGSDVTVGNQSGSNVQWTFANVLTYISSALTATGTGSFVKATSPTLVTPALGTPSAAVLTNASGTAANLTSGHVTTNANLTGPITSSGNATSVAAQTGTGSTFVMSASPTISTPTVSGTETITSPTNTTTFEALHISSANASPTDNDLTRQRFYFNNSVSSQVEFVRISARASGVASTHEYGDCIISTMFDGTFDLRTIIGGSSIFPAYDLGQTLGLDANRFSDAHIVAVHSDTINASSFVKTTATIVGSLPSAATAGAGARAFVTDASTTIILGLGLAVVGGGANKVPVFSDGADWIIG